MWIPLAESGFNPFTLASTRTMSPFCVKLTVPLTELPLVGASTAVADCFLLKKSLVALQPATNTKPQIKIHADFISFSRYLHWPRLARAQNRRFLAFVRGGVKLATDTIAHIALRFL